MSFYYIKNIKLDKENNNISADLADSCWSPIEYSHINKLFDDDTFEEKYANFIYNLVSGNFHPAGSNKYSKLVMNNILDNYYDDVHDIGMLNTYNKYKDVIKGILSNNMSECQKLESDRALNPEKYYVLTNIKLENNKDISYYTNKKGDLYCLKDKELMLCSDEGEPLSLVYYDLDMFKHYNSFLIDDSNEIGL